MKLRLLGCGASFGVPRIGDDWGQCDPAEPRNRRRRVSVLVEHEGYRILVDTSPDLREQLLAARVASIDAVIWTHDHADHCHGLDDLRAIRLITQAPVPAFAEAATLATLRGRFAYAFEGGEGYPPILAGETLPQRLNLGPFEIASVEQPHGPMTSTGLCFSIAGRSLAYSTDCHQLTESMIAAYRGVDLWVVGALRRQPHPTHAHLALVLEWVEAVRPRRTVLTHMDNSLDYATLRAELPAGVDPGHDGLEIEL
ncbi:MAG: MBL fold metallo-hydrolase [Sphingosinicella sp.]